MAKDKIQMPSGMGGLTRYFDDEYKSAIEVQPEHVVILGIIIMIIIIILHMFGNGWLGG